MQSGDFSSTQPNNQANLSSSHNATNQIQGKMPFRGQIQISPGVNQINQGNINAQLQYHMMVNQSYKMHVPINQTLPPHQLQMMMRQQHNIPAVNTIPIITQSSNVNKHGKYQSHGSKKTQISQINQLNGNKSSVQMTGVSKNHPILKDHSGLMQTPMMPIGSPLLAIQGLTNNSKENSLVLDTIIKLFDYNIAKSKKNDEKVKLISDKIHLLLAKDPRYAESIPILVNNLLRNRELAENLNSPPIPLVFTRVTGSKILYKQINSPTEIIIQTNKDRNSHTLFIGTYFTLEETNENDFSFVNVNDKIVYPSSFGSKEKITFLLGSTSSPNGKMTLKFPENGSFLSWFIIQHVEIRKHNEILKKLYELKGKNLSVSQVYVRTTSCTSNCNFVESSTIFDEIASKGGFKCSMCNSEFVLEELEFDEAREKTSNQDDELLAAKSALADALYNSTNSAHDGVSWNEVIFESKGKVFPDYQQFSYSDTNEYISSINKILNNS